MTAPEWTPEDEAEAQIRDAARAAQKAAAEPALQNLLTVDDPDWAKFQSDDPEWFLRAAGAAIRKYVGWHIYPNLREHVKKIKTGAKGIIMLPSRYVTEVDKVTVSYGEAIDTPHYLHHDDYLWYEAGWIQLKATSWWTDWYMTGYYYGNDPYYLPITQPGIASVTFWHGYTALPEDVKEVAYELAEQAMAVRAGNVKSLMSPGGYRVDVTQSFGLTLNADQKNRLANYRIGMTG